MAASDCFMTLKQSPEDSETYLRNIQPTFNDLILSNFICFFITLLDFQTIPFLVSDKKVESTQKNHAQYQSKMIASHVLL